MLTEGGVTVLKDAGHAPSGVVSVYVQGDHANELSGVAGTLFSCGACGAVKRAANVPQLL